MALQILLEAVHNANITGGVEVDHCAICLIIFHSSQERYAEVFGASQNLIEKEDHFLSQPTQRALGDFRYLAV